MVTTTISKRITKKQVISQIITNETNNDYVDDDCMLSLPIKSN